MHYFLFFFGSSLISKTFGILRFLQLSKLVNGTNRKPDRDTVIILYYVKYNLQVPNTYTVSSGKQDGLISKLDGKKYIQLGKKRIQQKAIYGVKLS